MGEIRISRQLRCKVWEDAEPTSKDALHRLEPAKPYLDDEHLKRSLKRCRECGQLFFFQFLEEVDWANGNDPQYRLWIPVDDEESGDALSKLPEEDLPRFPRIVVDYPADAAKPSAPRKIQ